MARSLLNAKLLTSVAETMAVRFNRRNYAATAQGMISNGVGAGNRGVLKQREETAAMKEGGKCSWMPDPVTGHFVPEDRVGEVDIADLREALLNQRSGRGAAMLRLKFQ